MKKALKRAALALLAIFLLIQLWRPARENPPARPEDTIVARTSMPPEVASILERSCKDCHSHETAWPWYSHVAPVSWILAHDVQEGREHLNLSEWSRYGNEDGALHLGEMCKEVRSGAMPMSRYVRVHPEASLSDEDRRKLCEWTSAEGRRLMATP
jgi:hypothetical protein